MRMNDEKILDIIIEIKSKLSSIDTKVDGIAQRLENHEHRIVTLEKCSTQSDKNKDWKNDLIGLLVKGVVASIFVIGSLAGAGSILAKMFGNG